MTVVTRHIHITALLFHCVSLSYYSDAVLLAKTLPPIKSGSFSQQSASAFDADHLRLVDQMIILENYLKRLFNS